MLDSIALDYVLGPETMRYRISHTTHYTYDQAVFLQHHTIRLRPRSDGTQTLHRFQVTVDPTPQTQAEELDAAGNSGLGVWFDNGPTHHLIIKTSVEVETHRSNPFDYFTPAWGTTLPVDYPSSLAQALAPYLQSALMPAIAPNVVALAQHTLHAVNNNLSYFLTTLTQQIYDECAYGVRPQGDPLPAGVTWETKQGSCRDFTVLFMEACRAVGLAARFVSGYQEGDPDHPSNELHAWAEVYVPGGGWRGFDPTYGLAVSDRHIPLAAAAHPRQAAPVTGSLREGTPVCSTLTTHIAIEHLDPVQA
ncbi:MAG: transglutaminase family protein [Leptolyngbya sp.]|nr:transglutaminase family protein [Leptolyngbya sp.]